VTLPRKRGELSFTDGPFAETKEQLAGFIMIEALDLEAAKEIARGGPAGAQGDCGGVIGRTVLMVGHFCSSAPPPFRSSG
jgi:hypothetical protein